MVPVVVGALDACLVGALLGVAFSKHFEADFLVHGKDSLLHSGAVPSMCVVAVERLGGHCNVVFIVGDLLVGSFS